MKKFTRTFEFEDEVWEALTDFWGYDGIGDREDFFDVYLEKKCKNDYEAKLIRDEDDKIQTDTEKVQQDAKEKADEDVKNVISSKI